MFKIITKNSGNVVTNLSFRYFQTDKSHGRTTILYCIGTLYGGRRKVIRKTMNFCDVHFYPLKNTSKTTEDPKRK